MAARNRPAIRLTFTGVQGSNDAFKEIEINTGLSTLDRQGYRIVEIGVQLSYVPSANTAAIEFAICRQSQTAVPALDDRSLLFKTSKVITLTTSGATYQPDQIIRWQPTESANVIIVEETIYCQLDSSTTSQINGASGYILVEQMALSESDKVALIAQSLGNF